MRSGQGNFVFDSVDRWGSFPKDIKLGEVAAVGVDSEDRVYLFNRGKHPVVVTSTDGEFINCWGEGMFSRPHGLHLDKDQTIWLTDDGDHCVRHFTLGGKIIKTIGTPGKSSGYMSGKPFCMCTHSAISPEGDLYVADGYQNAAVHKFSKDGKHVRSWGTSGTGPGEFNIVHNIACDEEGLVYVADRENHRIQVFDGDGNYLTQWNNLHRPCAIFLPRGRCEHCFVGELPPVLPVNRAAPNLGPRISVVNAVGERIAVIGDCIAGTGSGQMIAPHGIAFDSRGDMYVADVAVSTWHQCFPDKPMPDDLRTIHKFRHAPPNSQDA